MATPTISNSYVGDGSTVLYSFTFPYIEILDVKVTIDGVPTTEFSFANATTIQLSTAPADGAAITIFRSTDNSDLKAAFFPGSAIRARDLCKRPFPLTHTVPILYHMDIQANDKLIII